MVSSWPINLALTGKDCVACLDAWMMQTAWEGGGHMQAIHLAAKKNEVDELCRLLDEYPGLIEAEDGEWSAQRPLHYACYAGAKEAVGAYRILLTPPQIYTCLF